MNATPIVIVPADAPSSGLPGLVVQLNEVYDTAARYGALPKDRLFWPLVFRQRLMTFRKPVAGSNHA